MVFSVRIPNRLIRLNNLRVTKYYEALVLKVPVIVLCILKIKKKECKFNLRTPRGPETPTLSTRLELSTW